MAWPRILAVALALVTGSAGCAASTPGSGCGPPRREALDAGYLQHVLPGQGVAPRYSTDPPTSGPHQPAPPVTGASADPIPKPVQVGLLEAGKVLVQYRSLDAAGVHRLEALAGQALIVAPARELPGDAKVVATAWTWKLTCGGVDTGALQTFAKSHIGKGPNQN